MRNNDRAPLSITVIGGALLLSGLICYLAFCAALPVPLERLRLKPLPLAASVKGSAFLGSLPSLTHVTAFGLLTCALLRPRVLSALVRKSSLPSTTKERPT